MADYDVVVIGSGAGGLTAAVALANAGKRVLVLEQHYMAGGWCHSFVLDGYRFSPGVHYIGEIEPGEMLNRVYRGLGISGDLEFCRLNDDGYDHFLVAGERFDVPTGRERFIARLQRRFPQEREAIQRYFDRVSAVCRDLLIAQDYIEGLKALQLPFRAPHLVFKGLRKLGPYLDRNIKDPLLRAFLVAQAGDYGVPPCDAPFALHAAVQGHYFGGGFYPRGGAYRLPRAYVRQLKRQGGEIRLSTRVTRILVDGGRAIGVELEDGQQISADAVISNADPEMTFRRLVGVGQLSHRLRKKLQRTEYSVSSLGLFLATHLDLRSMGFDSGNYWYYRHADVDAIYSAQSAALPGDEFDGAFLTVTTLKDPSKRKDGEAHTLEVFTFLPYDPFAPFAQSESEKRDAEYEALKKGLVEKLLKTADRIVPGLSESLVFLDAGTPLTNTFYCEGHLGAIYGTAKIRRQLGPGAYPTRTELPGLYMVGASTVSHGVAGVTISGIMAASQILRCHFDDVLTESGPELARYPSEHPEEWLDALKAKRDRRGRKAA